MSVTPTFVGDKPLVNLRDLGGMPVRQGVLRNGKVMRSDDVSVVDHISAHDLVTRGLTLVLDLRSVPETQVTGRGVLAEFPVEYMHLPMTEDTSAPGLQFEIFSELSVAQSEQMMGIWYANMLVDRAQVIVRGLQAIAENPGASLFHCAAGKDRTGVFAASLLAILGAKKEDIVADYAKTDVVMEQVMARIQATNPGFAQTQRVSHRDLLPAVLLRAPQACMSAMFEEVSDKHGSVERVLRRAGLNDQTVQLLEENLVEI